MKNTDFGIHFIVGITGSTLSEAERNALALLQPAGIILFGENIEKSSPNWPNRLRQLVFEVREAIGREECLISIDHEGGKVCRLPPPITQFPPAASWGSNVVEVAETMGRELADLGINLNYAPVADIHSEPQNPVINVRAFGSDAATVATSAVAFLRSMQSAGVTGCAKHFPGHGHTTTDSHLELPIVTAGREVLESRELVPFRALVAAEVPLVMSAHVVYQALDQLNPATLSKAILDELLRHELNFRGAVVSDALEMNALANLPVEEVVRLAVLAGVDLLLMGQRRTTTPLELALHHAQSLENLALQDPTLCTALERSHERIHGLLREVNAREKGLS